MYRFVLEIQCGILPVYRFMTSY